MDDLIRRSDAIDAFKKELTVGESKGNYVTICSAVGYEGARQILESLPSAQQSRLENAIHGKSPEEIYEFIIWLFFRYAKQFTDSRHAVINWLKGESDGEVH